MSQSRNRFVPAVEPLDERITPSTLTGTPRQPLEAPVVLEGHQALVFFLGGIPSRESGASDARTVVISPRGSNTTPAEDIVALPDGVIIDFDGSSAVTELSVIVYQARPVNQAPGVGVADNIYAFKVR